MLTNISETEIICGLDQELIITTSIDDNKRVAQIHTYKQYNKQHNTSKSYNTDLT